jgi:hypothetical protein
MLQEETFAVKGKLLAGIWIGFLKNLSFRKLWFLLFFKDLVKEEKTETSVQVQSYC